MKLEFHHINVVSEDVDGLHAFYTKVVGMDDIPAVSFPRTPAADGKGYDGKIAFATEGTMQMHIAERDLDVAANNGHAINPVERGHFAFRTDDITAFIALLEAQGIPYSDYGTTFSQEWHQVFFRDPAGNVIEVHGLVADQAG